MSLFVCLSVLVLKKRRIWFAPLLFMINGNKYFNVELLYQH